MLALAVTGHGQTAAPQSTFRTGIDLVRIDVTVLDGNRRPVRGLSASDFTLLVDGTPRPVIAFAPMDVPAPIEPPVAWMRDVASDVVSNSLEDRRLVLILMDDASSTIASPALTAGIRIARDAIDALGPADLAAVAYTFTGRVQEFTNDREKLRAAVDAFRPKFYRPVGPGMASVFAGPPLACGRAGPPGGCGVALLHNVADALAAAPPGRKMLIYVGSAPFQTIDATDPDSMDAMSPTMDMLRALQRSNIAIYAFDPEGLVVDRPPSPDLRTLADLTGGRAIMNTNRPWEHVAEAFEENSAYYLLGFSAGTGGDGRFRKVDVRVNRPDATVRARVGYYATAPSRPSKKAPPSPIDFALAQGLPTGNLPMFAAAAAFAAPGKKEATVAVVTRIPEQVTQPLAEGQVPPTRHVNVIATAVDDARRFQGALKQSVDVTLRAGADREGQYEVISRLPLKPGRYQVRFAAETASQLGTVFLDVDVPDFAKAALSLSGLVLQKTPRLHVVPADGLGGFIPVVPTSVRDFVPADRAVAFVRAYQGGGRPAASVTITSRIRDAHDNAVYDVTTTLAAERFGTLRAADHLVDLPLGSLAPGEYLLTIEATLGKVQVRRDLRFTVH